MKVQYLVIPAVAVLCAGALVFAAKVESNPSGRIEIQKESKSEATTESKSGQDAEKFSKYVDKDGNISLPVGYKQNWAHLGGWADAKTPGTDVFEIHDVYTPKENITAFNKNGVFPDGTVLVKEIRNVENKKLTTGHATWGTDIKIWFVMIKDTKNRFPDNKHWGKGWGWALFEAAAADPTLNVSRGHAASCLRCHVPVKDTDWVYTYGYPELKQPKKDDFDGLGLPGDDKKK